MLKAFFFIIEAPTKLSYNVCLVELLGLLRIVFFEWLSAKYFKEWK